MTVQGAHGFKNFGDVQEGDVVLGPNGEPVQVLKAYEAHVPDRMYEIEMEDGTLIKASGNHLWYIEPQDDVLSHSTRLKQAKQLLSSKAWRGEALTMAEADVPYEIGVQDLMAFCDFIEDESERYFLLSRVAESIGHIVEEETAYQDVVSGEEGESKVEKVYDARRFFQQLLALTGKREWRKRWPVIRGRVVTTDVLFHRYPDAEIPTPVLPA